MAEFFSHERGEALEQQGQHLALEIAHLRSDMMAGLQELAQLVRLNQAPQTTPSIAARASVEPLKESAIPTSPAPASFYGENIPGPTEVFDRPARRFFQDEESQARRLSSFNSLLGEQAKSQATTMFWERPKFGGRKLSSLRIPEVLRFCEEVRAFSAENGASSAQVPIGKLIETEVQMTLLAKSDGRLLRDKFYEYSGDAILLELQRAVRPLSLDSFKRALQDNVSFPLPPTWVPDRSNGEVFFDALVVYAENFSFVFSFLSKENAKNTPALHGREGGVLRIFASKIPHGYGKKTLERLGKTVFPSFSAFATTFLKQAESTREASRQVNEELCRFEFPEILTRSRESAPPLVAVAAAPLTSSAPVKKPYGCYTVILHGKCESAKCPYQHDAASLEEAFKRIVKKLSESPYGSLPRGQLALVHDANVPSTPEDNELFYDDEEDLCCADFGPGDLEVSYISVDVVSPQVGSAKLILDTGTTSSNYISSAFLEEHGRELGPLLRPGRKRIRLLDGSLVVAHRFIRLGIKHRKLADPYEGTFWVLNGLCIDLLVGCYDACSVFNAVLVDHLVDMSKEVKEG